MILSKSSVQPVLLILVFVASAASDSSHMAARSNALAKELRAESARGPAPQLPKAGMSVRSIIAQPEDLVYVDISMLPVFEVRDDDECQALNGTHIAVNGTSRCFFVGETGDWEAAEQHCQEKGGHLASIRSEAENHLVFGLFNSLGLTREGVWIGASDNVDNIAAASEGDFKWVDGSDFTTFNMWTHRQPNNWGGKQDCVVMWNSSPEWQDDNCQLSKPSVCVKPVENEESLRFERNIAELELEAVMRQMQELQKINTELLRQKALVDNAQNCQSAAQRLCEELLCDCLLEGFGCTDHERLCGNLQSFSPPSCK